MVKKNQKHELLKKVPRLRRLLVLFIVILSVALLRQKQQVLKIMLSLVANQVAVKMANFVKKVKIILCRTAM